MTTDQRPEILRRNMENLNQAGELATDLVTAMHANDGAAAKTATETFLAFIRGLDKDASEQLTLNTSSSMVQYRVHAARTQRDHHFMADLDPLTVASAILDHDVQDTSTAAFHSFVAEAVESGLASVITTVRQLPPFASEQMLLHLIATHMITAEEGSDSND